MGFRKLLKRPDWHELKGTSESLDRVRKYRKRTRRLSRERKLTMLRNQQVTLLRQNETVKEHIRIMMEYHNMTPRQLERRAQCARDSIHNYLNSTIESYVSHWSVRNLDLKWATIKRKAKRMSYATDAEIQRVCKIFGISLDVYAALPSNLYALPTNTNLP
jgi:hypothetical protein